tara:strand:- start:4445 stop:5332 length:888 start_codon:yes stop_codon:yes gene_type:complete
MRAYKVNSNIFYLLNAVRGFYFIYIIEGETTQMFKTILVSAFILLFSSCTSHVKNRSLNDILPRQGYIFIEKTLNIKMCADGVCSEAEMVSVGSGFVVKKNYKGVYALTAAHVCNVGVSAPGGGAMDVKIGKKIRVETLDGRFYKAEVIATNNEIDACLMFVEDLVHKIDIVEFADEGPKPGDRVLNIASPYGIHFEGVVPLFEGLYIGDNDKRSLYTFTAAPGSSGSMILNADGELIGLVHSVYYKLYEVVVGVSFEELRQFTKKNIRLHEAKEYRSLYAPPLSTGQQLLGRNI